MLHKILNIIEVASSRRKYNPQELGSDFYDFTALILVNKVTLVVSSNGGYDV